MSRLFLVFSMVVLTPGCRKPPEAPTTPTVSHKAPPGNSSLQAKTALQDMEMMKAAMLRYRTDVGELPPRGDFCSACFIVRDGKEVFAPEDSGPRPHMTLVEKALLERDGPGWNGPYLKGPIPLDPWGKEYTYDDNDLQSGEKNPHDTFVWSAGPDRLYHNDDDIRLLILAYSKK